MDYDEAHDDLDELPPRPRQVIPLADRELLELAARALGAVRVEDVDGELWLNLHFADGSTLFHWNSLMHKDDAFNLLVELRLDLLHGHDEVAINEQNTVLVDCVEYGADPATDACRAVTRAAAEIGKKLLSHGGSEA